MQHSVAAEVAGQQRQRHFVAQADGSPLPFWRLNNEKLEIFSTSINTS